MRDPDYDDLEHRENRKLIYVAGPYTVGSPDGNIRNAVDAAEKVRQKGYVPFVPHLNILWGMCYPEHGYQFWLEWCLDWLAQCDAILRIEGESKGGDIEVEKAREHDLPVYFDIDELPEVK